MTGWRPEPLSLLLGFVAGLLAALSVYLAAPRVRLFVQKLSDKSRAALGWLRLDTMGRLKSETVSYVESLASLGDQTALSDLFIWPRVVIPQSANEIEEPLDLGADQMHYLWPEWAAAAALPPAPNFSVRQMLKSGRRVVIVGDSGTGKTTLLAFCARLCAQAKADGPDQFLTSQVPIFVHMAELDLHAIAAAQLNDNPLAPLAEVLEKRHPSIAGRHLVERLQKKGQSGELLLLLDGWDLLTGGSRDEATDWLQHLLSDYPDIQVLVAGPVRGFGSLVELGFVVSGILPWRVGQAAELGERWYQANELDLPPALKTYWRAGQTPLETNLRLMLLTVNSESGEPLPRRTVELMELSLRQALPQSGDDPSLAWLAPAARELWQQMAYELLSSQDLSLSETDIMAMIGPVLADYDIQEEPGAAERLLSTLRESSLFVVWHNRSYGFRHTLWRDYLAASYMVLAQMKDHACRRLADPYWANTVRFFVGRSGVGDMADAILESNLGSRVNPGIFQVASWLPEAPDSGSWRRQTLIRLGRIIVDENEPVALRQAAIVALSQTGENGVLHFLRQLLQERDPHLRQVVLAAIARVAPQVGIDLSQKMAADGDGQVRWAAVHALAWIDLPEAEKPLLSAILEPDVPVYRAAAEGLALNGTRENYAILREAVQDKDLNVRRAAVYGLALVEEPWAKETLETVAQVDNQWVVKSAADSVLSTMNGGSQGPVWRAPQPGDQSWLVNWAASHGRSVPVGPGAMPMLMEALNDKDWRVRAAAATTIGHLAVREAEDALVRRLTDDVSEVREAAYAALCQVHRAWGTEAAA